MLRFAFHQTQIIGAVLLCFAWSGGACRSRPSARASEAPTRSEVSWDDAALGMVEIEPGVWWREETLEGMAGPVVVWTFLPGAIRDGARPPLLLTTPPHGEMITGAALTSSQRPNYSAWARAGFAVIAYSTQGDANEDSSDMEFAAATTAFQRSRGGLDDLGRVLEQVSRHPLPVQGDAWLVGEGASGTHALVAAAVGLPCAGVIARNAMLSTELSMRELLDELGEDDPRARFFRWYSPERHAKTLRVPVLLIADRQIAGDDAEILERFRETLPEPKLLTIQNAATGISMGQLLTEQIGPWLATVQIPKQ